jgi:hypothetical protein
VRLIRFAILISLSLFLGSRTVVAETQPDALLDLSQQLSRNTLLCANFDQAKILKVLTHPLNSKGRIVFVAEKGVLWQVIKPFPAKVLVKETELIKWEEDGTAKRLGYEQSPLFHTLTKVFLSFFAGDMSKLKAVFVAAPIKTVKGWRVSLIPKDKKLAKVISRIEVGGGQFVENVQIDEARSDKTLIQFSDIDVKTCELGKAEKESFAF